MSNTEFVQIGVMAMRNRTTGEFEEPMPIFARANEQMQAGHARLMQEAGRMFAELMHSERVRQAEAAG